MIELSVLKAEVSFGGSERPQYQALEKAVNKFYSDLLRPLERLAEQSFRLLGLPKPKADSFRYTAANRRVIDEAVDLYLAEIAGEDRSRKGYVKSGTDPDSPDPILQANQRFSLAVGLRRGADLADRAPTISAERTSPATRGMLDRAFERLSEKGALRLEQVRDQVHGVLTSATEAGLSPLNTGRQLSALFDQYKGFEFERLARTEAAFASIEGSTEQMAELGVQYLIYLFDASACPICLSFDGILIGIDETEKFRRGQLTPTAYATLHPLDCFEAGRLDHARPGVDRLGVLADEC